MNASIGRCILYGQIPQWYMSATFICLFKSLSTQEQALDQQALLSLVNNSNVLICRHSFPCLNGWRNEYEPLFPSQLGEILLCDFLEEWELLYLQQHCISVSISIYPTLSSAISLSSQLFFIWYFFFLNGKVLSPNTHTLKCVCAALQHVCACGVLWFPWCSSAWQPGHCYDMQPKASHRDTNVLKNHNQMLLVWSSYNLTICPFIFFIELYSVDFGCSSYFSRSFFTVILILSSRRPAVHPSLINS